MHTPLYKVLDDGTVELAVHAQPGAGRTQITGRFGEALKVRVAAPPEQGRANEALAKALADGFGVETKAVSLVSGETSRTKRFRIIGMEEDDFVRRLDELVEEATSAPGPTRKRR
ncbi:MAG: uncharacterized protein QOJ67_2184 [Acidimicrobiaceae bacterium]|jgi:uncharacterized protein (TIGR00251 family)